MTTLQYKIVKIRKERRCSGCCKKFPIGRKMRYWAGIFDGEFQSNYVCTPCEKELGRNDYSNGYGNGELRDGRRERVRDWQSRRKI